MKSFLLNLSTFILKNKKIILSFWIVLLIISVSFLVLGKNQPSEAELKGVENTEADKVSKLVETEFNMKLGNSFGIVLEGKPDTTELEAKLKASFKWITKLVEVKSNKVHTNKLLYLQLRSDFLLIESQFLTVEIRKVLKEWSDKTNIKTYLTGNPAFHYDADSAGKKDSVKGEAFALVLSFFILIYNFGGLVAALLPLLIGVTSIIYLNSVIKFFNLEINALSIILTSLVGLALAIDYSLFIVSRFKEEIGTGKEENSALDITLVNSGKTIIVSALIMLCSISALFLPNVSTSRAVVANLCIVIVISLFNSLFVLPSFLLVGKKFLNWPLFISNRISAYHSKVYWEKLATYVVENSKKCFILSLIILLSLSIPVSKIKLWEAVQNLTPHEAESMQGYKLLEKDGWGGELVPVVIIVKAKDAKVYNQEFISYLHDFTTNLESVPEVDTVQSLVTWNKTFDKNDYINFFSNMYNLGFLNLSNQFDPLVNTAKGSNMTIINIYPKDVMNLDKVYAIINFSKKYAQEHPQYEILTGGVIARAKDFTNELYGFVPMILTIIFLGIFLILVLYMRTAILPIKAGIMNFLPIFSAFGVLTIIYQNDFMRSLFNVSENTQIINLVPIVLFCVVFGLSMDYEVLILSRITEIYEETGDVKHAIIEGISKSGSVITGAVLILIAVFVPGIFSASPPTKQICVGITSAILIDATIVRLLLVPSFMMLMGKWNWWNPFSKKV